MSYFPEMQTATLADIEPDVHGLISKRTAELNGVNVTEVTFHVGSKWSNDLKDFAGTELCELPHVAIVTQGVIAIEDRSGEVIEFAAGDAMLLPPGHDAWAVGDVDCKFVEFSRGNDYYDA